MMTIKNESKKKKPYEWRADIYTDKWISKITEPYLIRITTEIRI